LIGQGPNCSISCEVILIITIEESGSISPEILLNEEAKKESNVFGIDRIVKRIAIVNKATDILIIVFLFTGCFI